MTYLHLISPTSGSPTARILELLDVEIDALMGGAEPHEVDHHRSRAAALGEAIACITMDDIDDIRNVAMLRYEARNPETAAEEDED